MRVALFARRYARGELPSNLPVPPVPQKSKHVTVSEQEKLKIQEARQCVLCPYCEVPNASRVAQQSQVLQRQSSLSNASS